MENQDKASLQTRFIGDVEEDDEHWLEKSRFFQEKLTTFKQDQIHKVLEELKQKQIEEHK